MLEGLEGKAPVQAMSVSSVRSDNYMTADGPRMFVTAESLTVFAVGDGSA